MIDILVQARRDRRAAERFLRKLLKGQGREPRRLITDELRSYSLPIARSCRRWCEDTGSLKCAGRVPADICGQDEPTMSATNKCYERARHQWHEVQPERGRCQ